jgi:hypothetical protein
MEEVVEEAAVTAGGEGVTTSPEVALEVAIHSPALCADDGGHLE